MDDNGHPLGGIGYPITSQDLLTWQARVLTAAIVRVRHDSEGAPNCRRKLAGGDLMRCVASLG